jgi:hypothetical protein
MHKDHDHVYSNVTCMQRSHSDLNVIFLSTITLHK